MADASTELLQEMTRRLTELGEQISTGGRPKTIVGEDFMGGAAKNFSNNAGKLSTELGVLTIATLGVTGGFEKLLLGSFKTADAISGFGNLFNRLVPNISGVSIALKLLGTGVEGVAKTALALNESLKTASKNGVYFGNDLGDYSLTLAKARMSTEEFNKIVSQGGAQAMATFGYSVDVGAKQYLDAARQMQETPMAEALIKTGVTTEELNNRCCYLGLE